MFIKQLNTTDIEDFKNLIEIFREVFENKDKTPDNDYLGRLLANPDFLVFVVKINNRVVGGLTIHILHGYYTTKPAAYIYDVGITPDFQGKGLGKALMEEVLKFCEKNGFDNAYVEAESEDREAVNFYRKTNPSTEMNAIHFTYSFDSEF